MKKILFLMFLVVLTMRCSAIERFPRSHPRSREDSEMSIKELLDRIRQPSDHDIRENYRDRVKKVKITGFGAYFPSPSLPETNPGWIVKLTGQSGCLGVMIEKDVVMTAAHCLFNPPNKIGGRRDMHVGCKPGVKVEVEGTLHSITYNLRLASYEEHVDAATEGLIKGDLGVAFLRKKTSAETFNYLGVEKNYSATEECFLYQRSVSDQYIVRKNVTVKPCDFVGAIYRDPLCFTYRNGGYPSLKGNSGGPIVCGSRGGYYLKGFVSTKSNSHNVATLMNLSRRNLKEGKGRKGMVTCDQRR